MDLISFLANKKNSGNKQENTEPDGDMAWGFARSEPP